MQIPVGAAFGWRHALGSGHGFSVYASPSYVFLSGTGQSKGLVRAALGADIGITSSMGATAGVEFGQGAPRGALGPSSTLWGLGFSYALGRR